LILKVKSGKIAVYFKYTIDYKIKIIIYIVLIDIYII